MGRRAEVCGGEWGGEGEGVGGGWERRLNPSRGTHYKALLCPADASVTGMKRPGGGGGGLPYKSSVPVDSLPVQLATTPNIKLQK